MASSIKRLDGKVAIITGGASGIGESTVILFWENGAKVVIADIQDEQGQAIADKLGENVCYIHCNISNEEDIINLVDSTVAKYGQLDIMYNNAGISDRPFGSILETMKEDVEQVLGINLIGSFLGAKHAARVMVPKQSGCILFTASAATAIGGLSIHQYTMSKCGIWGLMRNLAAELGQYAIAEGGNRYKGELCFPLRRNDKSSTGMTEEQKMVGEITVMEFGNLKGKILKSKDIAKSALFLASDESGYVSGLNLVVDGGYSIVNPTTWKAIGLIK